MDTSLRGRKRARDQEKTHYDQQLRNSLPRCTGRDHAVAHRAYVMLGDFVVAFGQSSDKIAECVAINRYLT